MWIQFSQISNSEQIAEGGYGIIYKATWLGDDHDHNNFCNRIVAVKRFPNSQNNSKHFLNEVIILDYIYIYLF